MEYWKNNVALLAIKDITKYYQQESLISNSVGWHNLNNKETRYLNWLLGVNKVNYKGELFTEKNKKNEI